MYTGILKTHISVPTVQRECVGNFVYLPYTCEDLSILILGMDLTQISKVARQMNS